MFLSYRVFGSPSRYVQGRDLLNHIPYFIDVYGLSGKSIVVIADELVLGLFQGKIEDGFQKYKKKYQFVVFHGECSCEEIDRIQSEVDAEEPVFVGIGGGKAIDVTKAVADIMRRDCTIVPTIAATDAPTASASVIYYPDGKFREIFFYKRNPNLILVDVEVIANAPYRFFVSGMADALATGYEAMACWNGNGKNVYKTKPLLTSLCIAKECSRVILTYGMQAGESVRRKAVTPYLEYVVEANILMSGLGFEGGGLAAAHSVANGLTVWEDAHRSLHGEKVAFGLLVQLVLQGESKAEFDKIMQFNLEIGLPVCLKDIGGSECDPKTIESIAKKATEPSETIHNMLGDPNWEQVRDAIYLVDGIGSEMRKKEGRKNHDEK